MNETIDTIKNRRSVRRYIDKEIPKSILKELVDCARLAPTARNIQAWEFVIVTDKEKLRKLGEVCTYGKFLKDAAAAIVVCADRPKTRSYLIDGSAATQNILLAAKSLDIGSCWVQGYEKDYNRDIAELLKIPAEIEIVSIVSLGYYDGKDQMPPKRELDDVLHWEKY